MNKLYPFFLILCFFFSCKKENKPTYKKVETPNVFISTDSIPNKHYVGDKACAECHPNQFKDWQNSHHDKAMQVASRQTILAPFDGEKFRSNGVSSHFFQKNNEFWVNTEGPDGKNHDYKIIYAFGITPLQQYIVKFPNGHFQCLRTAWDVQRKTWYDLYPDFKVIHSEWLHWSRGGLNWNTMCADCHSTNVRKNYNEKTHSYNTTSAILNVSCEACHGPGKDHMNNVQNGAYNSNKSHLKMIGLPSKELVDECARCHSRRENYSEFHNHEGTYLDHYFPQLLTENIYHADGQILDEDYVYGSFVQSKMYHNGVTCTNCHNPHSLQLKFNDNRLCMQCHEGTKFNTPEHHKHKMGTESALCINCHMTGKTYMGIDFRRDHSFRRPRPDQSLKYGTPNACTQCHTDKDNQWAYDKHVALYGAPRKDHFSDLLAEGFTGTNPHGDQSLLELAKDSSYPNIARASAINALRNYQNPNNIQKVLQFLKDESPLVKGASVDLLGEIDVTNFYKDLLPLLKDKKRTVRVKTFGAIAHLPFSKIPKDYKELYKKVRIEYASHLKATAEFTGGRLKRAQYYYKKGNINKAVEWYEKALKYDYHNNIVRTNLAQLYYQRREYQKAEKAYKTIIEMEPDYGLTYYNYALLLNELQRPKEAFVQMQKAYDYLPENDRIVYNLSLLYHQNKQTNKGVSILKKRLAMAANNTDLLYLLAYLYAEQGNKIDAKKVAQQLLEIQPNNQQFLQLYNSVNQ